MIQREQLAAALDRLDSFDREILDFSLRRRVPDEALAKVYDMEPGDVAKRRAAAIERLSVAMDVQRGQDLGHMLQALLEPETWSAVTAPEPPHPASERAPQPAALEPEPEPELVEPEIVEEASRRGPVLEMLARPRAGAREADRGRSGRRVSAALAAAATVLLPAGGIVAAAALNDGSGDGSGSAASQTRTFKPAEPGPIGQPFPADPAAAPGYPVAHIRQATVLYDGPGGNRKLKIPARTEWGTIRTLGVVRQSGSWAAVQVPELPNGEVGWVETSHIRLTTVPWSLHANTSRRTLTIKRDGKTVRRLPIAVGNPDNPTPSGRFSVTDKLKVSDPSSPYGCCAIALTGHQVRLPEGWPGGDRLALHATRDAESIGKPVSLGCMRMDTGSAQFMLKSIPVGTPIFIKS